MWKKYFLFTAMMTCILGIIGYIFWMKEVQYLTPTPVPKNHIKIPLGQKIELHESLKTENKKPMFLHFYNADCPCSRFNIKEFKQLLSDYEDQVQFKVIIQSEDDEAVTKFIDKFELKTPVVHDIDGSISVSCGIYSTPQAAIIDKEGLLYYKGNYNKARFCTQKDSRFADIALDNLLKGNPLPKLSNLANVSYGCELPINQNK